MPELFRLPLWGNFVVVLIGGAVVWFTGIRLSNYAHQLSKRTRLSDTFAGLLLLSLATSLTEVASTLTAGLGGNAQLATGNLLGGVALQTALLAVVDGVSVRGALTYFSPNPVLLMQAVMLVLMLATAIAATAAGEVYSLWSVGAGTTSVFVIYLVGLVAIRRFEHREPWKATDEPETPDVPADREAAYAGLSTRRICFSFAVGAALILVSGWAVTQASDAIADQTGLGASFVGATVLAFTSSLPELSTTIESARLGAFRMAISNMFGSNALTLAMLFLADLSYREGVILREASTSVVFIGALGIVLTCVYLWGLLERDNRSVAGVGWDSAIVLVLYAGGLFILYNFH